MKASGAPIAQYRKIGDRIRFFREQAGLSQAALSERIGFQSPNAVFYIEQGERRVKVLDLIAIAKALGINVDVLLTDYVPPFKAIQSEKPVWGESIVYGSVMPA